MSATTDPLQAAARLSRTIAQEEGACSHAITHDSLSLSPVITQEETTRSQLVYRKGIDADRKGIAVEVAADVNGWKLRISSCKAQIGRASLEHLAAEWHVSPAALDALEIGFEGYAHTFPMRDADGQAVGLHLRPVKGGKSNAPGSRLGLFLPRGVTPANVQLVCEGLSDTAAALSLGFAAVGTPGAGACAAMVVAFVGRRINGCPCVMGDNDDAGRMGADVLREELFAGGLPYRVLFPPDAYSDLREWLIGDGLTAAKLQGAIERARVRYPARWSGGFSMLPHATIRRGLIREVGPAAFAVLCAIASFQDSHGKAWPSRKHLAELTGLSVATVDRALPRLRDAGVLKWQSGYTSHANMYACDFGPCKGAKKHYAAAPAAGRK